MDIPAALFGALSAVVDGRVYPDEAPQTADLPLIVYRLTGQSVITTLDGMRPPTSIDTYAIDIWSETRSGVLALVSPAQAALRAAVPGGLDSTYQGMTWGADYETGHEGCSLDYTIINRPSA